MTAQAGKNWPSSVSTGIFSSLFLLCPLFSTPFLLWDRLVMFLGQYFFSHSWKEKQCDYVSFICLVYGLNPSLSHSLNMYCLTVVGHMRDQSPRLAPVLPVWKTKHQRSWLLPFAFTRAIKHILSIHSDRQLRPLAVGTWGALSLSDTFLCFCLLASPASLLQDHLVLQGSARGSFFFFPFSRFPWCTHMDSISTHHRWAPDSHR